MATTRTDDKLDKNITRLLMQSPLGLTIGDITAAAKCTPQTARKSLARIGAEKDASGMLYVLRDDDTQQPEQTAPKPSEVLTENWGGIPFLNPFADAHAPEPTDPAPVAEAPAAQPELTPFQIASEQYKPGDKIMILSADPMCSIYKREMVGTVQTVIAIRYNTPRPILAEIAGQPAIWGWMPHEVRLATAEEIAAAQKLKPLRRGDLVEYDGRVCVVAEIDPEDGDCWVAALTGEHGYDRVHAKELTRIGSIRKKVKRIKKEMEGGK